MIDSDVLESLGEVSRRLEAVYGRPANDRDLPVLDGLIYTMLSQNTTRDNTRTAYDQLRRQFAGWDDVLAAPVDHVVSAIRPAGLAVTRAPRIQAILGKVQHDFGELSLETLAEWDDAAVEAYLSGLPGVGLKTIACVLLFYLKRPVFPVDTHVHRLARRLGWVPDTASRDRTFRRLDPHVPDEDKHALHVNLIRHGRAVCRPSNPKCGECVLLDICPEGQRRTASG